MQRAMPSAPKRFFKMAAVTLLHMGDLAKPNAEQNTAENKGNKKR